MWSSSRDTQGQADPPKDGLAASERKSLWIPLWRSLEKTLSPSLLPGVGGLGIGLGSLRAKCYDALQPGPMGLLPG
jgi:hypothetical protein